MLTYYMYILQVLLFYILQEQLKTVLEHGPMLFVLLDLGL